MKLFLAKRSSLDRAQLFIGAVCDPSYDKLTIRRNLVKCLPLSITWLQPKGWLVALSTYIGD